MRLNRRQLLIRSSAGLAAAGFALNALPAFAQSVDVEELMTPGPLPEMVLGSEDAPLTIVEYASMTCGHCANFHKYSYPHLKSEYIAISMLVILCGCITSPMARAFTSA